MKGHIPYFLGYVGLFFHTRPSCHKGERGGLYCESYWVCVAARVCVCGSTCVCVQGHAHASPCACGVWVYNQSIPPTHFSPSLCNAKKHKTVFHVPTWPLNT